MPFKHQTKFPNFDVNMMRLFNKNTITWQLQLFVWVIIYVLSFLSNMQFDPPQQAIVYSTMGVIFYAAVIFGNAYWLIPHFYYRKKYTAYAVLILLLLMVSITIRNLAGIYIYNKYFTNKPEAITINGFIYSAFTGVLIFLFSVLYRLALDYFKLTGKQAEIKAEQVQTELNLLKQQVQPHFLFNTLNNIYYVAQKDSPEAAELIERLSAIIRYFMEESKKERVFLTDEVALLKSYIELEGIRMRYEMPVDFVINGDINNILVPPLLLLPMTENIYKHGIDKRSKANFAKITLTVENRQLLFATQNRRYDDLSSKTSGQTGLQNLRKRLVLYFGTDYSLITAAEDDVFTANLKLPLYENQLYHY